MLSLRGGKDEISDLPDNRAGWCLPNYGPRGIPGGKRTSGYPGDPTSIHRCHLVYSGTVRYSTRPIQNPSVPLFKDDHRKSPVKVRDLGRIENWRLTENESKMGVIFQILLNLYKTAGFRKNEDWEFHRFHFSSPVTYTYAVGFPPASGKS